MMSYWSLDTLEFADIKSRITEYAASDVGKEIIERLVPSAVISEVELLLQETTEGMHLLRLKGDASLVGVYDIRHSLQRATISGILNEQECLEIGSVLLAGRKIKSLLRQVEEEHFISGLKGQTERIVSLEELRKKIDTLIDPQGFIRDDASVTLKNIRYQMSSLKQKIRNTLTGIIRDSTYSKMLQEPLITERNHRYVVPVKQEYRTTLKGIVHDQSASGATLFIEPAAIFQLNNQLRDVELDERKEKERILKILTDSIAAESESLTDNLHILAKVDVILAKAKWGRDHKAICPAISSDAKIVLKKAKHPFISKNKVVPMDVVLTDYRAMLITGPNAGGKTVILKMVGLFALMTQCGIPILAEEESSMPIFSGVFADIGDEQSITQSLSTFSGHLTTIIRILDQMDKGSLILLDELGSGTDPTEGAALAISILECIIESGCTIITTTHYSELKHFAYNHPYTVNASVEFDIESLRPTYRLMIGTPGSSNAFAISQRLGLPQDIIEKAKTYLSGEENRFEKGIADLHQAQKEAMLERNRAADLRKESEVMYKDLKNQMDEWEQRKSTLEERVRIKIQASVVHAEKEVEEVLRQLEQDQVMDKNRLIHAKTRLRKAIPDSRLPLRSRKSDLDSEEKVYGGDEVFVYSLNQKGTIVEKLSEKEYLVQMGALKMKLRRTDFEKRASEKEYLSQRTSYTVQRAAELVGPELDLRGKAIDESIPEIEKYLDNAILAGLKQVFLIHGKGTGVLGTGIQRYLRGNRMIKAYRFGNYGEGGMGVTVVDLN